MTQRTGVYTSRDYASIIRHLNGAWDIEHRSFSGKAAKAQDYLCRQPERYENLADEIGDRIAKSAPRLLLLAPRTRCLIAARSAFSGEKHSSPARTSSDARPSLYRHGRTRRRLYRRGRAGPGPIFSTGSEVAMSSAWISPLRWEVVTVRVGLPTKLRPSDPRISPRGRDTRLKRPSNGSPRARRRETVGPLCSMGCRRANDSRRTGSTRAHPANRRSGPGA